MNRKILSKVKVNPPKVFFSLVVTRPMWGMFPVRIAFGTVLMYHGAIRLLTMRGEHGSFIEELPSEFAIGLMIFFSVVELLGGLFIVPGFLSRFVGFGIVIEIILSIFLERIPLGLHGNVRLDLLLFAIASMILFSGGGRFSIDRLIARRLLKKYPSKKWEHYLIAETPYCEHWYE